MKKERRPYDINFSCFSKRCFLKKFFTKTKKCKGFLLTKNDDAF